MPVAIWSWLNSHNIGGTDVCPRPDSSYVNHQTNCTNLTPSSQSDAIKEGHVTMRIIQGSAIGLLVAGTCLWVGTLPDTAVGGPPVRLAVGRTLLLTHADGDTAGFPRMSPIPTQWDSSPQLLPTQIDTQFLLASHFKPIWIVPTGASRVTTTPRTVILYAAMNETFAPPTAASKCLTVDRAKYKVPQSAVLWWPTAQQVTRK